MGHSLAANPPARRATGSPDPGSGARGQRILSVLGAFGHLTHEALVAQVGDEAIVTNAQVVALCELALRGPLRPRDLQAAAALTSGGTTKLLDGLDAQGLIDRVHDRVTGDRRGVLVSLTPLGEEAAARLADAIEQRLDGVRKLNEQLAALLAE